MNDALVIGPFSTSWLELISFLLSVVTVWLNVRQLHWAWLFSIASSLMYGVVFYQSALYGDMALQIVFVAVSVQGWIWWLRGIEQRALPVTALTQRGQVAVFASWGLSFVAIAAALRMYTDSDVPYSDAFLTAGSLVGQYLLAKKRIENWLIWIAVDVLYVGLYLYKGLQLTAVLYGIFVLMAVQGWKRWKQDLQN
ncbi:nicotinamide riboside transporter PnuC [Undibacterium luofuense]|uniref:Nicotinamide riboside transporter PnuC n=1 Tax=Undibacterium luofuense TaxID=2828733 RepID=A0A941I444_9BURK|nr:nicotinamide riboside transporter PnuC [Undibacterium luofuense]MBR7781257.1 nicotinamide mononucleotide transporter [Undibacterium luofuense]